MIFSLLTQQLHSLSALLLLLSDKQYDQKVTHLGNASIGGHTRHIIELLKCVLNGYEAGTVDYMNRQRNLLLETNRQLALKELDLLKSKITRADKPMYLITDCNAVVCTTFYREIVYNAEHTVHHLALIKVALREMNLDITHHDFGMAPSTIKYLAAQDKN